MKYILNKNPKKGTSVYVPFEGEDVDLSSDHPYVGKVKIGDIWSNDCVVLETTKELDPRLTYNVELRVINELMPDSPEYVIDALKKQEYELRTDPLTAQITRLSTIGEAAAAAEVEAELTIENEKIQEEFNEGTLVYITESGTHYHTSSECTYIDDSNTLEVPLSEALAHYEPCSLCV